ncbi:MAG: glutathione S-transferase family protein [Alphaproteobacteria bacterium]|nr:glutathione S-transferase family protein [Alphaproteobacteria bacterium]
MLKLWGRDNSINVQKAMWTIAELALPHERIDAGGKFGLVGEAWFLKMNPNGRVPVIDDDGYVLYESNAICRYLAARYGLGGLCPSDWRERGLAEQWMDWQQTTLNGPMTTVFLNLIRTEPAKRDMAAVTAAGEELGRLFGQLDRQLAGRDYVLGKRFSMADIPVGAAASRWQRLDLTRPSLPSLEAWLERLGARPAFQRHVRIALT